MEEGICYPLPFTQGAEKLIGSIHVEGRMDRFVQLELNYSIRSCTGVPVPLSAMV